MNTLGEGYVYPSFPIFDEHSKGIVFIGIHSPIQKLGTSVCLNRKSMIYYMEEPKFEKAKEGEEMQNGIVCLNEGEYMAL